MAHTPGHWRVEPWSSQESQVVALKQGAKSLICAGVMPDDARLIAASPSLLAAAEEMLDAFAEGVEWHPEQKVAYTKLHFAIARAKGE